MKKALVLSGHPDLENGSLANKMIIDRLKQESGIEIRDLQKRYPDFKIDILAEQQALIESETVVLQFPFYWYSIPGIMKEWLDRVFAYGFAFGSSGDKLKDKNLIISTTIGGPEESYQTGGYNTYPVDELFKPLYQTANLSGMKMQPPIVSHGMVYIPNVYNTKEAVEEKARIHSELLIDAINDCTDSDNVRQSRQLVHDIFRLYDRLAPADELINYLSEDLELVTPQGEFSGHEGFREWYNMITSDLQGEIQHSIKKLEINEVNESLVELSFEVTFSGKTKAGEKIGGTFNETWQIKVLSDGNMKIKRYLIDA